MKTHLTVALVAGTVLAGALATAMSATPAAAAPNCQYGFATVQRTGWLLKCRKTVALSQLASTQAQAAHATCRTDSYWNFGPKVTTAIRPARRKAIVTYLCGHVEG